MNKFAREILLLVCIAVFLLGRPLSASNILPTKHNLSSSGAGLVKSTTEDRVCIFCHTPHNSTPQTPLWNKNLNAVNYTMYSSSTMIATQSRPTGPSRLCLSCHDGTLALGDVKTLGKWDQAGQPMKIEMQNVSEAGGILSTSPSYLGTSLAGDHPFSFSYFNLLPNPELSPVLPSGLLFYNNGTIHCTTCHDPHDNSNKKFLRVNSEKSGLCTLCHTMNGWTGSVWNTSQDTWIDKSPPSPYPWPRTGQGTDFGWTTVRQNGCENCHAPHSAAGQKRLLNCFTASGTCNPATEEGVCFPCHNGNTSAPIRNIFAQLQYTSRHNVYLATGLHDPKELPFMINGHVECVDCHNPHRANDKQASPPFVSGMVEGVSGVTVNNTTTNAAVNEYEICFKCHASPNAQSMFLPIPRVINNPNMRVAFQTVNPSFHPVVGANANIQVPSLIGPMSTGSMIYCTDCHSDDNSPADGQIKSRGPHGSKWAPILAYQYDTTNSLRSYSNNNFALCYNCHYETSILSDNTFRQNSLFKGGHSGHLQTITTANKTYNVYASCSACHDPHGVPDNGLTGSHKRLINFDTRIVGTLPGSGFNSSVFSGSGNNTGNCALVCHDADGNAVTHDGSTKFSYGGAGTIGPGSVLIRW